jgi:hypothetical protein
VHLPTRFWPRLPLGRTLALEPIKGGVAQAADDRTVVNLLGRELDTAGLRLAGALGRHPPAAAMPLAEFVAEVVGVAPDAGGGKGNPGRGDAHRVRPTRMGNSPVELAAC